MRARTWMVVGALVSWPLIPALGAQSLGEAAKKEQETKAKPGARTQQPKTYTDEDLAKYRSSPPPEEASSGATPAPGAPGSAVSPQPVAPRSDPAKMPKPDRVPRRVDEGKPAVSDPAAGDPAQTAGLPAPDAEPAADDDRDASAEQQWRARADDLRTAVGLAENKVEGLQYRLDGLRIDTGLDRATDPFRLQKIQAEIGEVMADLARAKAELEAARKALEDFEEEARRANVPPGWIRERPNGPES